MKQLKRFFGVDRFNRVVMFVRRLLRGRHFIMSTYKINGDYSFTSYVESDRHLFCGYYDIDPFTDNGEKILCHRAVGAAVYGVDEIEVGYLDSATKVFHHVASSSAWNWQTGSRLRWMPGRDGVLSFHVLDAASEPKTKLFDVRQKAVVGEFRGAIDSYTHDGKYGFKYDYAWLAANHSGYGYENAVTDNTDGITMVNLEKQEESSLVTLSYLQQQAEEKLQKKVTDGFVNLVFVSPLDTKIMFLYRCVAGSRRLTFLVVSDMQGKVLSLLSIGSISHMNWVTDNQIIITSNQRTKSAYYLYDIEADLLHDFRGQELQIDGHPSYSEKLDVTVTDTVPDLLGERQLLLIKSGSEVESLATFYNPRMGPTRCDLHPRIGQEVAKVCFDYFETGNRAIGIIDL